MVIKIIKNTIDNYIDSSIILYGFDNASVLNLAISNPSTISNNALDVFDNASLNDVSFPTYGGFKTALIGSSFLEVVHLSYGFVTVNLLRIDKIEVIDSANTKIYFDRFNSLDVNVSASTLQTAINNALLPPISDVIKFVSISADVPTTSTTFADITNLRFPVISGEVYWFRMLINYTQGSTSAGCAFAINGPAITTLTYRPIKYKGYDKNASMKAKMVFVLKAENRFLHIKEIAKYLHKVEPSFSEDDFVKKLYPAIAILKKSNTIIKYEHDSSNFNTFWGSPNWKDADDNIKPENMYDESQIKNFNKESIEI